MTVRPAALSSTRAMATATYVYCVVRSARKPSAARVPSGLPGAERPHLDQVSPKIWVVHAAVPLDRYGTQALEESLRDLEWVSAIAVAHEAVVEFFARTRGATVIPMKLFTLFSTPARAITETRRRSEWLASLFAKLQGCEEWGVRIMRRPRSGASDGLRPATGAAFLAARKRARDESQAALRDSAQAADDAYEVLAGIAADHRRRQQEASGVIPPLLDAAFLVPVRRRARFRALAARAAESVLERGGRLTLTGPWPAYNFVSAVEEQG
jgi:gas vesicle protein GvpL/GvpF